MADKSEGVFLSCKEIAQLMKSGHRISGTYAHWNPDGEECTHADCAERDRQNAVAMTPKFGTVLMRVYVDGPLQEICFPIDEADEQIIVERGGGDA